MPHSDFWNQVASDEDSFKPRRKPYTIDDLIRSHADMRAALRLAGQRIDEQTIGRRDEALLRIIRQVYQESRVIGRQFEKQAKKAKGQEGLARREAEPEQQAPDYFQRAMKAAAASAKDKPKGE